MKRVIISIVLMVLMTQPVYAKTFKITTSRTGTDVTCEAIRENYEVKPSNKTKAVKHGARTIRKKIQKCRRGFRIIEKVPKWKSSNSVLYKFVDPDSYMRKESNNSHKVSYYIHFPNRFGRYKYSEYSVTSGKPKIDLSFHGIPESVVPKWIPQEDKVSYSNSFRRIGHSIKKDTRTITFKFVKREVHTSTYWKGNEKRIDKYTNETPFKIVITYRR